METFSAATKMPTVHAILTNIAHQNWEIDHINVKSAYLNASLKQVIYYETPAWRTETRSRRKSLEAVERPVWSKTSWTRMVP